MCWIDILAFVFNCHCINIFVLESCLEQFSSLPSLFVDGEPEAHRILQVKPILCSVNMTVWVGDHPHVHQPNNGSILNTKLFFQITTSRLRGCCHSLIVFLQVLCWANSEICGSVLVFPLCFFSCAGAENPDAKQFWQCYHEGGASISGWAVFGSWPHQ